jgi:mRNA interferase MazF
MRLLRVWVPDPHAPGFLEEAHRQARLLRNAPEEREALDFIEAAAGLGDVKRGDLVTVALSGDYGKPRPAVVIQSDFLPETDDVLVCLLTTMLRAAPLYRLSLPAGEATGLREPSQVMVDKIMAVRRDRCGAPSPGASVPPASSCATRTSPASRRWPTPTPSRAAATSSRRAAAPTSRRNPSWPDQRRSVCPRPNP